MNAMPDFVELMIAEAAESIRANAETIKEYNSRCDNAHMAKHTYGVASLKDYQRDEAHLGNLDRDIERHGLPKRGAGVDKNGVQTFATYDPREPIRAKIAQKKRARNERMNEALPGVIDFVPWLKTQRGQVWKEAPKQKPLREGDNIAEQYQIARNTTDGTRAAHKRDVLAKLPIDEAIADARAWVDAAASQGAPSVFDFFASGRFDSRGKYSPKRGMSRPEFVTQRVGWEGNTAIEVVEPEQLIAFVAPDLLFAALEKLIRAKGNDANAIPAAEKPARIAQAAEAVKAAMYREAFLGLECVRANIPVHLRRLIHPAAYLGIDVPAAKCAEWE